MEPSLLWVRKPTKVSRKYLEDGTKVRVSKLSGNIIAKPDHEADRTPRSSCTYNRPVWCVWCLVCSHVWEIVLCCPSHSCTTGIACIVCCLLFIFLTDHVVIGPKDTLAEDVIKISFADYEKYLPYIYASERV